MTDDLLSRLRAIDLIRIAEPYRRRRARSA